MTDNTLLNTSHENVIEFIENSKEMTVTLSQARFISKVKKLAKQFPDEVKIIVENEDGTIVAHMPVSALHLNIIKREMTDEEKEAAKKRLEKARTNNKNRKG